MFAHKPERLFFLPKSNFLVFKCHWSLRFLPQWAYTSYSCRIWSGRKFVEDTSFLESLGFYHVHNIHNSPGHCRSKNHHKSLSDVWGTNRCCALHHLQLQLWDHSSVCTPKSPRGNNEKSHSNNSSSGASADSNQLTASSLRLLMHLSFVSVVL